MPDETGGGDAAYDLTALGWLQFEQLCADLLARHGVEPGAWLGEADTARWVNVGDAAATALLRRPVTGPAVACVLWFPRWTTSLAHARQRAYEAIAGSEAAAAVTVIVLTNAHANPDLWHVVRSVTIRPDARIQIVGCAELGALLDAHSDMWLSSPAALGVRRLDDLVAPSVLAASTFDLAAARVLAPTFVATRAYTQACEVVARHGFAVLTGPPEMGKTAIARMIGLVRLCQGFEVHECADPDALWRAFRADRSQVFVADDAFGSTEYRADAAERWARDLDRILKHMDARHVLLWTSRPAPLHAGLRRVHRENGLQRFPRPAEVMVDAADLSAEEKALILFRHAVAADLSEGPRAALRLVGGEIVDHPHITPERIRRLVAERVAEEVEGGWPSAWWIEAVEEEIARPTEAMIASFAALDPEHRGVLAAMLDAPPGAVSERDLAAALRRVLPGLEQPMGELVERLLDHFLRRVPPVSVDWVHPSWRDVAIDWLAADAAVRAEFLAACGVEGTLLALSVTGGPSGERDLPLLVTDADWDALLGHVDALCAALDTGGRLRLMRQLGAALDHCAETADDASLRELVAVAERVAARVLPAALEPADLPVLEEWYGLCAWLASRPARPDLRDVWVETLPTIAIDLGSADDLERLEAWAALATMLRRCDPDALAEFGYPEAQEAWVAAIAATPPAGLALEVEEAESLRRSARALAGLFPAYAPTLRQLGRLAAPRVPAAVEAPAGGRPRDAPPRRAIVDRVLADLMPPPPQRGRRRWRRGR